MPPKDSRRIDPSAFHSATILVAEGDRALRRTLRDVLLGMGFPSIVLAGTVAETMRQIVEQRPSVLLLDHKLPGGDGIALTRRLRRDSEELGRLPIILMAEAPDAALVTAARDAGVHEIVIKPIAVEGLVLRLMHVLKVPRALVRGTGYIGPDRRRLNDRRRNDRRAKLLAMLAPLPTDEDRRSTDRRAGKDRRRRAAKKPT